MPLKELHEELGRILCLDLDGEPLKDFIANLQDILNINQSKYDKIWINPEVYYDRHNQYGGGPDEPYTVLEISGSRKETQAELKKRVEEEMEQIEEKETWEFEEYQRLKKKYDK